MRTLTQLDRKLARENRDVGMVLNAIIWTLVLAFLLHSTIQNIVQKRPADPFVIGAIVAGIIVLVTVTVSAIRGTTYVWLAIVSLMGAVAGLILFYLSFGVLKEYDLSGEAIITTVLGVMTYAFTALGQPLLKPDTT